MEVRHRKPVYTLNRIKELYPKNISGFIEKYFSTFSLLLMSNRHSGPEVNTANIHSRFVFYPFAFYCHLNRQICILMPDHETRSGHKGIHELMVTPTKFRETIMFLDAIQVDSVDHTIIFMKMDIVPEFMKVTGLEHRWIEYQLGMNDYEDP